MKRIHNFFKKKSNKFNPTINKNDDRIAEPIENFGQVPDEIVAHIFSFFTEQDFNRAALVNHRFSTIAKDELDKRYNKLKFNALTQELKDSAKPISNLSEAKKLLQQINLFTKDWLAEESDPNKKSYRYAVLLLQLYKIMLYLQQNFKHVNFAVGVRIARYTEYVPITYEDYQNIKINFRKINHDPKKCAAFIAKLIGEMIPLLTHSKAAFSGVLRNKDIKILMHNLRKVFFAMKEINPAKSTLLSTPALKMSGP